VLVIPKKGGGETVGTEKRVFKYVAGILLKDHGMVGCALGKRAAKPWVAV